MNDFFSQIVNTTVYPIKSTKNSLVTHWLDLRKNKAYRYEQKKVLIEGLKMIQEVCKQRTAISLICSDLSLIPQNISKEKIFLVLPHIIEKISGVSSPEGILAEVAMSEPSPIEEKNRILLLEGINDPGNLGTLFRTALAFDWEAIVLLSNSCDPYNEKALRAAKGATFAIPFQFSTWNTIEKWMQKMGWQLYVADLGGTAIDQITVAEKRILLLGSEAHGISDRAKNLGTRVTIPMKAEMESLNVSVAGGILMFLLNRKN